MKKTKILSLLLCLSLFCALIVPGTRAYADNEPDSGMKISKTATANADGSYTITLEAYAIGSKVITEQKTDIPTDIVLVIDQSGSMKDPIGGYTYTAYREDSGLFDSRNYYNEEYYPLRHNGGSENLWHKLNDNEYVAVSVEQKMDHTPISGWDNGDYYSNQNNLYCLVNGEYKRVNVTSSWGKYEYYVDGSKIGSGRYSWNEPTFDNGYAPLYQFVKKYTYSYTLNGVTTVIKESFGDGSSPDTQFYRRDYSSSAGGSKLNALKSAVTSFVNKVNQKALGADGQYGTGDDVAHRIAIVGFASNSRNGNTELLSTQNATDYWSANDANYRDALVPACSADGKVNPRLSTAIGRLDSSGDTYLEYGMDMANKIFAQYPITADDTSGRQRVVVVFTDGYPAPYGTNDFKYSMADNAISNAYTTKDTYKATVYTVGLFNTADPTADINANFATSDGWYDGWYDSGNNLTDAEEATAANRYMHYVSSNYLSATSLNNGGTLNPKANPFNGGDSYYLSAGDEVSLNSIFQQISDQIETGGSSTTLDANAEIRDVVSNAFTMPEKTTDINLYTAESNGSTDSWKSRVSFNGTTSINESERTISVSGFSFKDNWCGNEKTNGQTTFHDGKKLIIEFTVKPEAGFLGGNNVFTNGEKSGLYENSSAENALEAFPQPQVNVPIQNVTVTAADKNVYLLGGLTADELKSGATVTVGEGTKAVSLDLSKANENYGLETWQTAYVDIAVEVKDANGTVVTGLTDLTADTTYTISVTVAPKTAGSITAKTGTSTPAAKINVFKPELTFEDSEVYYGADAPTKEAYDANNLTATAWKHGETLDTTVTMIGTAPELDLTYTPEGGKVNTKQDIAVDVAVKINGTDVTGHTTFVHTKCADDNTCTDPANGKFWLHIQTCTLNITKQGGAADESYVFDVYKGGEKYSEVTVWGNGTETLVELPIGTYSISENAGWSWRYSANNGGSAALTAQNPTGSIACTNTKNNNQWLNGFSEVVRNIFDTNH